MANDTAGSNLASKQSATSGIRTDAGCLPTVAVRAAGPFPIIDMIAFRLRVIKT